MRFVLQLILLIALTLSETACINRANLTEGIICFRAQHYRQAFIRLKPEADKGQPDAEYAVGYMYYYGHGVIEDRKQARYWIKRAAVAGQPDAIQALKILKRRPRTVTRDPFDPLIYQSSRE
ncbi:Sel1 repeat [Legionella massiliensis]|uniref:Sel1 repeat n=1 Tax=Legionella massiliensis TaxID=1034943 RepID=A0A078KUJ2_9GAMM|nr:SEL1-like repeat protein [Legionella massiliensis]CDZ78120.1 Sel1 repeat [Legionella massiliensis]CEE13858.1 Sel1 repeat protein [Legionella massiliensis]